MTELQTRRLMPGERELARQLFMLMAAVFEEEHGELSDGYIDQLLGQASFWAFAAFADNVIIGGLTAHVLPLTRVESTELFIYDIAVHDDQQRRGVGRSLMSAVRAAATAAGIETVFVPADNEDLHALDFYRALGGESSAVTFFTFTNDAD